MTASLGLHPKSDRAYLKETNRTKMRREASFRGSIKFHYHEINSDNKQEIQKSDLLKWTVGQKQYVLNVCDENKSLFSFLTWVKRWKHVKTQVTNLCEESRFRLPHHSSFTVCGVLKSRHKGPGAEGQAILAFVVPSLMDGDERSSIQNHSGVKYTWLTNCSVFIKNNNQGKELQSLDGIHMELLTLAGGGTLIKKQDY